MTITKVLVGLQDLTLHNLLQQEAAQAPVEEASHILPIQNILSTAQWGEKKKQECSLNTSIHPSAAKLMHILIIMRVNEMHTYSDDTFLLHPAWGVMEVHELHCHLVVDGQQEFLSGFELRLKFPALFVRQFWGS